MTRLRVAQCSEGRKRAEERLPGRDERMKQITRPIVELMRAVRELRAYDAATGAGANVLPGSQWAELNVRHGEAFMTRWLRMAVEKVARRARASRAVQASRDFAVGDVNDENDADVADRNEADRRAWLEALLEAQNPSATAKVSKAAVPTSTRAERKPRLTRGPGRKLKFFHSERDARACGRALLQWSGNEAVTKAQGEGTDTLGGFLQTRTCLMPLSSPRVTLWALPGQSAAALS